MAKKQTFGDKSKGKKAAEGVFVKVVKATKSEKGAYKFNERYERIEEIGKVTDIK
jgi:hypothetical protein